LEDIELIKQFQEEQTKNYAFNLIVKKYQQKVYSLTRKMVIDHDDANDLTQDTFIKVWNNLSNFRQDAQLFTWIYRIATNECLNFLAKKRRKFFVPIVDVEAQLSSYIDQGKYITGDEIQIKLQKAILTLPEKQRLVFNMKYFEELKYEEISDIVGTSVGALKASYHIAVKKIEEYINRD
jgi:RNA polymerase sigma-70 factor (ECF subfamily)